MKISVDEFMELVRKTVFLIEEQNVDLTNKVNELEKQASAQDGIIIILKEQRDAALKKK